MRHILHGFTMYIDGDDYGYDTETVSLPTPTPVMQEYRGGGMDLARNHAMAALEALEATVKVSGLNPEIQKKMAKGPGQTTRLTFRGAVLDEPSGGMVAHVAIVEGAINFGSRDDWQRGEKAGIEFAVGDIGYYRYEAGSSLIHEIQAWPPKRVVDGLDQLASINAALGYS